MMQVTIDDVKESAKLFDYGDNANAKQITDSEIKTRLDEVVKQINTWINELGLNTDDAQNGYYAKRYIVLETIVVLSLSNYSDSKKDYIDSLKLERDKYYSLIEKNARRFVGVTKTPKPPALNDGNLFG